MKKLLNTLYVTSENSYLALDGENIVIYEEQEERGRLPLHNLEGIVSFGYRGTSPALTRVDGRLCRQKYFFMLCDSAGAFFSARNRQSQRKCIVA